MIKVKRQLKFNLWS